MADMKHMANKQMERHMNKALGTESPAEQSAEAMPADQATCPACGNMFDPKVQKEAQAQSQAPMDPNAVPVSDDQDWGS